MRHKCEIQSCKIQIRPFLEQTFLARFAASARLSFSSPTRRTRTLAWTYFTFAANVATSGQPISTNDHWPIQQMVPRPILPLFCTCCVLQFSFVLQKCAWFDQFIMRLCPYFIKFYLHFNISNYGSGVKPSAHDRQRIKVIYKSYEFKSVGFMISFKFILW